MNERPEDGAAGCAAGTKMMIRTKLLLVLASVVLLVVAQGLMDLRYASRTKADVGHLGEIVVSGSSAALGMLDALSELETGLTAADDGDDGPDHIRQIRNQGEQSLQEFHRYLSDAALATHSGMEIISSDRTTPRKDFGPGQLATLKNIEVSLSSIETKWQDYTNCLEKAPGQARAIRDNFLLPALNQDLRPALSDYCQSLEDASMRQVQQMLQRSHHSQEVMLLLAMLAALAVLVAGFFLAKLIWRPVEQLARAARDVAAGNRQCRLQLKSPGEFRDMAGAFNHMLDVLQTTTVSRDELEKTVQERTRQLKGEITVRRAVEAELRAGEKYLTIILNSIGDGVLVTNAAGRVLRMNPVAEQLTGWTTVQAIGRPVNDVLRVINEHTRQPVLVPVDQVIAESKIVDLAGHSLLIDRAGVEHPIADSCAPIRDLNGAILGAIMVFRDVTEERQAEEQIIKLNRELEERVASRTAELLESERRHRTLLANLQGMAYRCRNDREWSMEFVSEGCRELLGVEPEDLTAGRISSFSELIHPEDRERVWDEVQSAIAKQCAFTLEYRVKHAKGQWRSVWEQGRAVLDNQGQVVALEGYITDMTRRVEADRERRILEDQLRRAQKMEAIGTLAGGIAHDFNNVLAAVLGSAELIKMDMPSEHPSREFLDQIFLAGNRAREVVQQILTFSQRRESERNVIALQPVVKECMKLLRSTIPAMVEISCTVDPACAPVLADPTQIHQIIMNLCTNAWQALPEKNGFIRVSLEMCEIDEMVRAGHPDLHPGPAVRLSICDNGSGMSKATLERIFEPFFTTKPVGEGSGLGLSVVHGIVKAHQGVIAVESAPGKGTTFHIYLPPQVSEEKEVPEEPKTILGGNRECIMFVDDDDSAGYVTEKVLNRFGYQVRWFKHPEEALEHFQNRPDEYDLVVSDLAMPGMTGDNLATALLKIRPDIPILITTGLIDPAILKHAREIGVCNVLLKPVSAATLAREIAQHLADRGGI
jgi:PAS domain S-box-containing protein